MTVHPSSRPAWYPLPRSWRAHALTTSGSVLLETAGGNGEDHISYLFTAPEQLLIPRTPEEFQRMLEAINAAVSGGGHAAGSIDYEAGYALQQLPLEPSARALARFGIYREPLRFDHHTGTISGSGVELTKAPPIFAVRALLTKETIGLERTAYRKAFSAIQEYLTAGDTYQVNFTTRAEWERTDDALDLYERLLAAQPTDFAAILHLDEDVVLSFSPELFFRQTGRTITTRPMKGTAPRGTTLDEDRSLRDGLAQDEKNRAEHLMIVDLLRSDLGRICALGSVQAEMLFHVESYPTVHQMVSSITGELNSDTSFSDVIRALFPSGSITGAPKRRTMQIIHELEQSPRGVYTGAIGFVSPHKQSCFSVPIRTLLLHGAKVSLGIGGGIVADSTAEAEFDEAVLKSAFTRAAQTPLRLIETLLWDKRYSRIELHLERMERSARELGFAFDRDKTLDCLHVKSAAWEHPMRVSLNLSADGELVLRCSPLSGRTDNLRVRVAARRVLSSDAWLRHKTTHRTLYDREFQRATADGFDEVIFLNERDELAEGAISNIFVQTGGALFTPPLSAGALPGVLRQHLLSSRSDMHEKTLRLEDLFSADAAFVGNSLRGLRLIDRLELE